MDLNDGLCAVFTRKKRCDYRKKENSPMKYPDFSVGGIGETILQIFVLLPFSPFKYATGIILQGSNTRPEVTLLTCSSVNMKTLCSEVCNEKSKHLLHPLKPEVQFNSNSYALCIVLFYQ
jgi:hypothetical protein